jgi:two-component system, cell cycle response regulator
MDTQPDIVEELEKRVYDLKNLINLGLSLSSNLNFESLVESILYACIGQLFVERVAILLQVDLDKPDLYIHMSKGYDRDPSQDVILKENSPLRAHLEANPEPVSIEHLREMPYGEEMEKLAILDPCLIVPMKSKNSLNGLLVLGPKMSSDDFSDSEKEFITNLSKFAAIAVENSRLYLMAILDRMTRLYIHHFFQERLIEEINRSGRSRYPISLIMSDIDHFKIFNDTYGHQQGDIVLKMTADIFKQQIRSVDIPARYGGEEFVIILPNTKLEDAIQVANRLRKTIEQTDYPGQDEPLHVTLSFGVAQYNPDKDRGSQGLIKRTDSALYKAKELGRNRVVAHE